MILKKDRLVSRASLFALSIVSGLTAFSISSARALAQVGCACSWTNVSGGDPAVINLSDACPEGITADNAVCTQWEMRDGDSLTLFALCSANGPVPGANTPNQTGGLTGEWQQKGCEQITVSN